MPRPKGYPSRRVNESDEDFAARVDAFKAAQGAEAEAPTTEPVTPEPANMPTDAPEAPESAPETPEEATVSDDVDTDTERVPYAASNALADAAVAAALEDQKRIEEKRAQVAAVKAAEVAESERKAAEVQALFDAGRAGQTPPSPALS